MEAVPEWLVISSSAGYNPAVVFRPQQLIVLLFLEAAILWDKWKGLSRRNFLHGAGRAIPATTIVSSTALGAVDGPEASELKD